MDDPDPSFMPKDPTLCSSYTNEGDGATGMMKLWSRDFYGALLSGLNAHSKKTSQTILKDRDLVL